MVAITPKPILRASYFRIGARYYDSDIGGWVSVDPMREFPSPYLYVGNGFNPVNGVDADGNCFGPMAYRCFQATYSFLATQTMALRLAQKADSKLLGYPMRSAEVLSDVVNAAGDPNPPPNTVTGLSTFLVWSNLDLLLGGVKEMTLPFQPSYWQENLWDKIEAVEMVETERFDNSIEPELNNDLLQQDATVVKEER